MFVPLLLALADADAPVTALCPYGDSVVVGRSDGTVEQVGPDLSVQTIISRASGVRVSFVAASTNGVAWLTGPGGAIREKTAPPQPATQTLNIVTGDRRFVAQIRPSASVRRLGWLQGRVAICYDFGASFFDAKGQPVSAASFMPAESRALASAASLWLREQEDGTELAVFAKPHSVRQNPLNQKEPLVSLFTAYQVGAWQWAPLGGFASTAFDAFPDGELQANEDGRLSSSAKFLVLSDRIGLGPNGIAAREQDSLLSAPVFIPKWESSRVPAVSVPGDSLWFGSSADAAWWWTGSVLVRQELRTGEAAAYLPWGGDFVPSAFAAVAKGIWIGSNRGLRYLDPSEDSPDLGGFVRVPLSKSTGTPDAAARRLADAIFAWRFADSEKAGADGGIMIASIFSTIGLKLPQNASDLMKAGAPVTGDMKFGDVILTAKTAAIYLGGKDTVEVRDGRVQNGEIWSFPKAVVRRLAG